MIPPLAAVSHALRTPLAGMAALLDLLARTPLDAEQAGHVAALREAADGMGRLVEVARALARLDAAGPRPTRAEASDVAN
ncbi:histidine kinase dimerization/phospho-acceptor domain-containing protein, partial [Roseisolibacter sp. H3M3-2]|uniref:histidine kinase dimerization/phospho-acceptor domain-containing protein n=1 Tax=Roseisolibacter sp. H3M3-2 TaxID=3031323 RepID=UPI0023DA0A7D